MRFGELLRELRTTAKPKKLSQEVLANVIGATRQYIDAIEKAKAGTPPPQYEMCVKLADMFDLSDDLRDEFMWLAFTERIRNNFVFYELLHDSEGRRRKLQKQKNPKYKFERKDMVVWACNYGAEWEVKGDGEVLTSEAQDIFRTMSAELIQEMGGNLLDVEVKKNQVRVKFRVSADHDPATITNNLKDYTSRSIKNKCFRQPGNTPSIWEKETRIWTFGDENPKISEKQLVDANADIEVKVSA